MDLQFVQALDATRRLAATRDERWRELGARAQRLIDRLGTDAGDPLESPLGHQRIQRRVLPAEATSRALAAMMAVADRDTDEQLELASDALRVLEQALSDRPQRRWRHRKDVIGRVGVATPLDR